MDETLPPKIPLPSPGILSPARGRAEAETAEIDAEALNLIGSYRVVKKLGIGGMGVVYKCEDEVLKRFVAIKVLRQKYAGDEHYRRRFHREAQTIASLSHPSVAHVYGMGEVERPGAPPGRLAGEPLVPLIYIVMEYVDGPSVESLLQIEGRLSLERAASMVRDTALGLKEALSKGIVHRDVKPSNLLVTASGAIKIVDFGLAKELGGQNSMTDEGMVVGTPHYISPEQGRGRPVDHRSDIYSLGATFYHMATGRPPFEGTSQVSVIVAHVNDDPPPPHEIVPSLPEAASRVILRMMAKSYEARYQTYGELIDDIDRLLEKKLDGKPAGLARQPTPETSLLSPLPGRAPVPGRERKWPRRVAALALLFVLAGAYLLWSGTPPPTDPKALAGLGGWLQKPDPAHDVLIMSFAQPPEERSPLESWRRLIVPAASSSPEADRPHLAAGALRWSTFSAPFACGLAFERIDEAQVSIGATSGTFDLGVAIVDPLGSERRYLLLRLRPADANPEPVVAFQNGEAVPIKGAAGGPEGEAAGLPPVPRLIQGPFDVHLRFENLASKGTRLRLRISKQSASRPLYQAACDLDGTDWPSGVLVLQTPSPVGPFTVALERVLISGRLAAQPIVEEVPWRS
jgi:serine/threonine protein kinase